MPVKKYNPVTPSLRTRVTNAFTEVTTSTPEKSLLAPIKKSGGRNHVGKMTMRYKGGGHKRRYRLIDFWRDKDNVPAKVHTIEYDPNRTAFIALVCYADGEKRYILAPDKLKVGTIIQSGPGSPPEIGNTLPLTEVPFGAFIHAVELTPGRGAQMARSAGTAVQLVGREDRYAVVRLPSGEVRKVLSNCRATIGTVSNPDHGLEVMGKAGAKRWEGRRPRTRGVAMNPVDHPMGGGEGRASGGHPRSRKGLPAKGYKTRDKNKSSDRLIITRRKNRQA
jgi:large subunit ribosomal protein L2